MHSLPEESDWAFHRPVLAAQRLCIVIILTNPYGPPGSLTASRSSFRERLGQGITTMLERMVTKDTTPVLATDPRFAPRPSVSIVDAGKWTPDAPPAVSVIMPCLNEARTVEMSLVETSRVLGEAFGERFEVVAVDDGSTDGTWKVAENVASRIPQVRVVRLHNNGGKGHALRTTFEQSHGDIIGFLDGDFDIHPKQLQSLLRRLETEHADVVVGSKRHPDSRIDYPRQRRILSRGYEWLVRALFGLRIRDTQAGIKVFRREVLERVLPMGLVKRYAFDAELLILVHRLGYRIAEAPIELESWDRIGSNINLREVVRMLKDTLGVFYRLYVTHYYDRPREPAAS